MKTIHIEDVGEVTIRKSARAKRLILKVSGSGVPSVTIPSLVPYYLGERFAQQHKDWFIEHATTKTAVILTEGKPIGQSYFVHFVPSKNEKISSRITGSSITVSVPAKHTLIDSSVQAEAKKASIRALRKEAENVLPSMLHQLAQQFGYTYKEVRIKAAQTRWGSCSSGRIINLSVWLMQVPDELIEYVICHELTHLNHMHHQADFWDELATMIPDYKQRRKALKAFQPALM